MVVEIRRIVLTANEPKNTLLMAAFGWRIKVIFDSPITQREFRKARLIIQEAAKS
jgi:hypothetical protein